jgi:hypothetical protein
MNITYSIDTTTQFAGQVVITYTLSSASGFFDPPMTENITVTTSPTVLSADTTDDMDSNQRLAQIVINFETLIQPSLSAFAIKVRKALTLEETTGLSGYSGSVSIASVNDVSGLIGISNSIVVL